jgi:hypothetical protein
VHRQFYDKPVPSRNTLQGNTPDGAGATHYGLLMTKNKVNLLGFERGYRLFRKIRLNHQRLG